METSCVLFFFGGVEGGRGMQVICQVGCLCVIANDVVYMTAG
jgi:hypothetical protein